MGDSAWRGFAPWIIFWIVASPSTWEYAAGGAFLAAKATARVPSSTAAPPVGRVL